MQYKLLAAVVLLRLAAFVAASPITDDSNNQITTDDSSTNVDQVAYNPADPAADPAPAVDSGTLISQTAPSRPRATKVRLGPGDFKSFDLAIDDSVCQISTSGGGNVPFHSVRLHPKIFSIC